VSTGHCRPEQSQPSGSDRVGCGNARIQLRLKRRSSCGEYCHRNGPQQRQSNCRSQTRRAARDHRTGWRGRVRGDRIRIQQMSKPRTIVEKIWDAHVVSEQAGAPTLLYIDLHLVHEVTSPQAFQGLRERGLKVRRPDLTVAISASLVSEFIATSRVSSTSSDRSLGSHSRA
jgi:hypothetical protein